VPRILQKKFSNFSQFRTDFWSEKLTMERINNRGLIQQNVESDEVVEKIFQQHEVVRPRNPSQLWTVPESNEKSPPNEAIQEMTPNIDYNDVNDDYYTFFSSPEMNHFFSLKEYYDGKTILCTGCTGFIGKVLAEKILRCLPNVKQVYVMIREKKKVDRSNKSIQIISGQERLVNEILRSPIMDRLVEEQFKGDRTKFEEFALSKLTCIENDVTDTDIFLPKAGDHSKRQSQRTKTLFEIRNEVNVILHVAATVGFTEPLPDALRLNVFGTLNILRFALNCPNIKSFTHVSTAYVNSNQPSGSKVFERFYPLNLQNSEFGEKKKFRRLVRGYSNTIEQIQGSEEELDEIEQFCERIFPDFSFKRFFDPSQISYRPDVTNREDENFMKTFTKQVLQNTKFPNTYTLTKHLAEKLVAKYHGHIPISIVRPTIVGAALKEPQPGWIDAVSAGAAVYLFIGLCVMRIIPGKTYTISDQIPVDFVVNQLLTSAVDVTFRQEKQKKALIKNSAATPSNKGLIRIYHIGTSTTNPSPWGVTADKVSEYWRNYPTERKISPDLSATMTMLENPISYNAHFFFRYTAWTQLFKILDKLSADGFNIFKWNEPPNPTTKYGKIATQLSKVEQRVNTLADHFYHFTMNEWFFDSSHVLECNDRVSPSERTIEGFELDYDFDWTEYLNLFCYGIQRFFLKEEPPYLPPQQQQHRAQQMRQRIAIEEEEQRREGKQPSRFNMKSFRLSKF